MTELKTEKQRTLRQNRALHVMFEQIAEQLNDAGYDMKKVLKPNVDIPWNKDTVKKYLWKPIMKHALLKESTTEMSTKDIDKIFDIIVRHFGEKFGLVIEFPSIETIINKQRMKKRGL